MCIFDKKWFTNFVINYFLLKKCSLLYNGQRKKRTDRTKRKKAKSYKKWRRKSRGDDAIFYVPNTYKKKLFLPQEAVEKHESTTACRFSSARRRLVREDFEWQCFWKLIKYSIRKFKFVYTSVEHKIFHAERHVLYLNRSSIIFCLFHRLYDLICYIYGFFLPSRERKFSDNVPNCVEQYNHCIYIFLTYSKQKRMRFKRLKKSAPQV